MNLWTINDYQSPRFLPKVIQKKNGVVEVDDGYAEYDIESESISNNDIFQLLNDAASPDSAIWKKFKTNNLSKQELKFFEDLESLGMIGEGGSADALIDTKKNQLREYIEEAVDAHHEARNAEKSLPKVQIILDHVVSLLDGKHIDVDKVVLLENNFFIRIGTMQLLSWQRLCPPALNAAKAVLESILKREDVNLDIPFGIYPIQEVRRCLMSLVWSILRSVDDDCDALLTELPELSHADHAINLGILAEKHAMESLELLGESKFLSGLSDEKTQRVLACAGYAQEYYITDRFIDLIAPSISKRLPRNLKALIRRYYNEEVGHEAFELKTCLALGMEKEELLNSMPTPFGQVICDSFSWLAHDEPLAYFSTISITEGLPGQRNPINEIINDSGLIASEGKFGSKHHEDLNFQLFHQLLPRWFLSECGELSVSEQERTLRFYNTMLEVSFRAWEELYHFHVDNNVPLNPNSISDYAF